MYVLLYIPSGSLSSVAATPNPAVDLAPFGRWTLRDKAAQRRSPQRSAPRNPSARSDWKILTLDVMSAAR